MEDPGASEAGDAVVREDSASLDLPLFRHEGWQEELPWLIQGITARGSGEEPFDLGLFGDSPAGRVLERWRRLRRSLGFGGVVHSRQVHGVEIECHNAGIAGLLIMEGRDGHVTATADVLLTISVADCVPIFVVDPKRRVVALLHGGWRGVAAGVFEMGLGALLDGGASAAEDLLVHFGPAICGRCYEVGPEVHRALGLREPPGPTPVDLRRVLSERARAHGIRSERITTSAWCTRCGDSPFFSHRGGFSQRQMALLGIRPTGS